MKRGDKVSIYQKPITGEDYEGEAVLSKPYFRGDGKTPHSEYSDGESGYHDEWWYVLFPEDGNAQTFLRKVLVDREGLPVFSNS